MFNKDFYPTPDSVIEIMLGGTDLINKVVLEPQAGKGNIVDYLKSNGAKEVLCCEKNQDLAKIVQSKGRFLSYDIFDVTRDQVSHIDLIVMNPPFSSADKHIQYAWELLPAGAELIAICNSETVNNQYTYRRENLGKLVSDHGTKQDLGPAFVDSERQTSVEISLIKLFKPGTSNDFGDYFDYTEDIENADVEGIMPYNAVRECVQRYVGAVRHYDEVLVCARKMSDIASEFGIDDIVMTCSVGSEEVKKVAFQKALQKKAWNWIFSKMDMHKYLTQSLSEKINKFVEQQENVPFTMKNIYKMVELVAGTNRERMDGVLEEVFDKLTKHYHKNRYSEEGWKTNSHYLIGKKFILPHVVNCGYKGQMEATIGSYTARLFDDLQKALCYFKAEPYLREKHSFADFAGWRKSEELLQFGKWYDLGFLSFKGYKKGTVHCKFKSENVWALLNQHIARIKGFPLPESVKDKT
ncbi:DNA methyltransferase [Candidatus Bathyarchaeota archaeon]|nr:MAG: DNA methyltransferase [Candidatus Bathyarchaeota archaeon]